MNRVLAVVAACLGLWHPALAAQPVTALSLDSARPRVTVPCEPEASSPCSVDGEVLRLRGDIAGLSVGDAATDLGFASASRMEMSGGFRSHRLVGAAVGFALGAGGAFWVTHRGGSTALCDQARNQDAMNDQECLGLVLLGGVVGAGLGTLIGHFVRTERLDVPAERLRVTLLPETRSVGATLRFGL